MFTRKLSRLALFGLFFAFLAMGGYYACGDYQGPEISQAQYASSAARDAGFMDAISTGPGRAVRLVELSATREDQGVRLAWRTGAEINCGSFRVLRCAGDACSRDRHDLLPNIGTIPCQDSLSGAVYAALDETARLNTAYSYYLREHETTGWTNEYGPVALGATEAKAFWKGESERAPVGAGAGADPEIPDYGCSVSAGSSAGNAWLLIGLGLILVGRIRRRS